MAYSDLRTRRIATVHALIGIVTELGGRIIDAYGHVDAGQIDVLLDELRLRIRECEVRFGSWDDFGLAFERDGDLPF